MTILPNTKKGAGSGKAPASSSANPSSNEVESAHHPSVPLSHPLALPPLPPENLALSPDRVFGSSIASASSLSLWSHTPSHSLSSLTHSLTSTRDERTSQPAYEHVEPGAKRRHIDSSLRSTRNKRRVERDRSNTSSPNTSTVTPTVSTPPETISPSTMAAASGSSSEVNGCNSEDEYESRPQNQMTEEEMNERERRFEKKMRKKGLIIKSMGEDGACLFRAVADQVYGDQDMHSVVRKHCMDYIAKNRDYFSQYVTEDFNHYVSRKSLEHVHGNHIEIQALSEMYNRTIEVFCYSTEPINTFHGTPQTDNAPIRLSYHKGIHYNSLVDPYKATIGVGLGLPGHIPGSADKNMMKEAKIQSEEVHIEQAMLEDKLRATDWEATNEAIEEQISRDSYLQWLKDNERRNRVARSPNASSSSATMTSASGSEMRSPRPRSHGGNSGNISPLGSPFRGDSSFKSSPNRLSPPPSIPSTSTCKTMFTNPGQFSPSYAINLGAASSTSNPSTSPEHTFQLLETSSFMKQLPPEMFGMSEWDDGGILSQVLAASQQEYLDKLKKAHEPPAAPASLPEPMEGAQSGSTAEQEPTAVNTATPIGATSLD